MYSVISSLNMSIFVAAVLVMSLVLLPFASGQACVKWGNTFDVSIESGNVMRNCKLPDGRKICCAAVDSNTTTRGVGASYVPHSRTSLAVKNKQSCTVHKKYVSSPQELREFEEAERIDRIPGDANAYMIESRFHALMEYVTSDDYIRNSTIWLERVKYHMGSADSEGGGSREGGNEADREFLSRFEFTRVCSVAGEAAEQVHRWTEWIEPIGITARHPFGFGKCRPAAPYVNAGGEHNKNGKNKPRVGRSDVDYVLLQSGAGLHRQTHTAGGRRFRGSGGSPARGATQGNKHFLFDAGTSTFDSSLFWFTCAYSQRGVSFDQVFGWEMTLLEPVDYWRRVPALWKPYWHFHNVPVQASAQDVDSPLRYIQQLAGPGDFVAFKLDIDSPDMEMPIALALRDSAQLAGLVDEFFFELHFR